MVIAFIAAITTCLGRVPAQAAVTEPPEVGAQIVGGQPADGAWTVSLQSQRPDGTYRHTCGGALIAPNWVVTVAACVSPETAANPPTLARAGSLEWQTGGSTAGLMEVIIHPAWEGLFTNAIALVRLDRYLTSPEILPVTVPLGPNGLALVAGFGTTCDSDPEDADCLESISDRLLQLEEKRLPDSECSLNIPPFGELFNPDDMMCMVSADGEAKQACFGDGSSAVVAKAHRGYRLVGLAIADGDEVDPFRPFACSTAPEGSPGELFVLDIFAHVPWIAETIRQRDPAAAERMVAIAAQAAG
ncbi:S1 family peptidase [Nonomuraea diastatica]|uniref:Trypsin-like serine protease n=1 Tax=Nonomuraea diastatica TaxID=1848329 RepID=A0A4R4WEC2_9ACTN|nr:trypsin-like serine protease [Nonomuraea diastatica]TDD16601.1 trypsin-like serine protease [Nonomuraea diastatica]